MTAEELIKELEKHPKDMEVTILRDSDDASFEYGCFESIERVYKDGEIGCDKKEKWVVVIN